jgi:hypothetical protein
VCFVTGTVSNFFFGLGKGHLVGVSSSGEGGKVSGTLLKAVAAFCGAQLAGGVISCTASAEGAYISPST